jgi:hypothetical protein
MQGHLRENEAMDQVPAAKPALPLTDEDYYYEGPRMVFTAAYLLKRGFCCGSGCRHCPYGAAEAPPAED